VAGGALESGRAGVSGVGVLGGRLLAEDFDAGWGHACVGCGRSELGQAARSAVVPVSHGEL
jgi:hypothetical protein